MSERLGVQGILQGSPKTVPSHQKLSGALGEKLGEGLGYQREDLEIHSGPRV